MSRTTLFVTIASVVAGIAVWTAYGQSRGYSLMKAGQAQPAIGPVSFSGIDPETVRLIWTVIAVFIPMLLKKSPNLIRWWDKAKAEVDRIDALIHQDQEREKRVDKIEEFIEEVRDRLRKEEA